ncbi:MAG: ABC transporter substrate-binding protein [Desulfobacterales bacterium CG07_land_8_20_14_0_80_52_14]|nr:MAG: ABC transporter substrate-binding protein [Desulfobacterales bacterium CG23_combo_of_CG06-09_8_20_14_all_52_9]PIU49144.1 MAG: ABC transporter substrate-binding protein [Desulfobacterales bacterium CG07_land_8_20_14_0_80_52_14]
MKRASCLVLWSVVALLALALTAGPALCAGKLKIGIVFSMTGGAAAYGVSQKEGAQLAIEQVNAAAGSGIQIDAVFEDDASVPQQGINVYNKLINGDKVAVIIGPTLSNTAKITDPIAQQAGVPVLAVSNTAGGITEIGDFIFRDSLTEAVVIPNTIKTAKEKLRFKKVAVFYGNDDAFTKSGYDVFKKVLQEEGVQILSEQTFAKGDRDFSPQLTQIKAQNPDAIICSALVEEASGIVSQARQLGIAKSIPIIGGNGFNSPALMKNAGEAAEGVIVGAAWNAAATNPLNLKFVDDYTKKYNRAPDQFAAQAFTGVQIVYKAATTANSADNRKAIRDAMAKIKDMDTLLGKFSFTEGRDANHSPVVQEVKGGKFAVFAR